MPPPLVARLAGLLLELQGLVNLIPPQYDGFVNVAFQILIVILGGVGSLYIIARSQNKIL